MPPVTIYTTAWCPYCTAAKTLLREKGVTFTEVDVEKTVGSRAAMTPGGGGRTSVPQIFIGETHVGGCDDLYALDRSASSIRFCRPRRRNHERRFADGTGQDRAPLRRGLCPDAVRRPIRLPIGMPPSPWCERLRPRGQTTYRHRN